MKLDTLVGVTLALLVATAGVAAATPGVSASESNSEVTTQQEPPSALPAQVSDFVSELTDIVTDFLDGVLDELLGSPVSEDAGADDGNQSETPGSTAGDGSSENSGDSSDTQTGDETQQSTGPPYAFTINNMEQCGQTCRDVTSTVTNQQDTVATGVTVRSQIFAGNSTDSSDRVWEGNEDVGSLSAGESYTATKRVELGFSGAIAVQQADGWITVQTTIQTDDQTLTYTERRNVL